MSASQKLKLYNHHVSSYSQVVRIALREKGLDFEMETPTSLAVGDFTDNYASINPRLQVPTLQHGALTIFDSKIICAYLEDAFPDSALFPFEPSQAPALKAKARMLEELCGTSFEAINWGWTEVELYERAEGTLKQHLKEQAISQLQLVFKWLEDQLGTSTYFCGETFSYADIVVFPFLNRSLSWGFSPCFTSPLLTWVKNMKERRSVQMTIAEFEETLPKLPLAVNAFKSGEKKREYRDHRLEWMLKSGGLSIVTEGIARNNIRFGWPPVRKQA